MISLNHQIAISSNVPTGISQLTMAQLQSIVELCPEPIIIYCENIIVYVNRACLELMGADSEQELLGKSIFDFLPPEKYEETIEQIKQLFQANQAGDVIEKEWIRLDGSLVSVEVRATAIQYGDKLAVQLICKDTTQRKLAEQTLQENEQRLYRMLKYSPEAIAVHCGGIVQYVNNAILQMFGAGHEEQMIGRPIFDFVHPDYHNFATLRVTKAETSEEKLDTSVHKMVRLDGEIFDAEAASIKIYDDQGKPYIQTVVRNITDRINYQKSLERSSSSYKRLVEFLPEPIVITDKGILIYANKSAHKLIKMSSEERLEGRSIFEFIHPDFHEASAQIVYKVMQSDEPSPFLERKLVCCDGEVIPVEISSIQIYNYLERSVTLSVLRDLTERKNAEELLLKSEKLSVVGQLAAGVAHEIRNPLTALKGFTQLLQKELQGKYSYINIMLDELNRINHIVNEFMTLSKPQANHYEYKDITAVLKSVISILETQAIMNNVNIHLEPSSRPLPLIYCDENQLKQVFLNIINNAIEAMKSGGTIKITAKKAPGSTQLSIKIHDQGPGIPSHVIKRLGEPFFTTKENGTGLGLMICHRIVEAHQGKLNITSKINHGTTAEIVLPIHDRA